MATQFPYNLDVFTDPRPLDKMSVVQHAAQHTTANDAIAALETKVGINNSTNTQSFDYRIRALEANVDVDNGGGGTSLLLVVQYNPGSLTTYSTTSTSLVALDTTNLRATFTAPTSGNVLVRLTADVAIGAGITENLDWGLLEASTTVGAKQRMLTVAGNATQARHSAAFYITGISAGSHSYDWAQLSESGNTVETFAGGVVGAAVMEVWSA